MTQPKTISPGMLVISSDGAELGRVKLVEGDRFKVDAPLSVDFWLLMFDVAGIEQGVALLNLTQQEVRHLRTETAGGNPIIAPDESA